MAEKSGRRVVVTGMGVVTSVGTGIDQFWNSITSGKSGVSRIETFDVEKIASKIAAQIKDFDPINFMDAKAAKRMDRFAQFAVAATVIALEDSGLKITSENENDVGVYIGSGVGGLATLEAQHKILLERGADRVSPFLIPMMICNMAAAQASIISGAKGPVSTVTTACAAGSNSIGDAFEIIKRGAATVMISGGSEASITPIGMAGFSSMNAMSRRNDEPQRASRPFDRDRDGFVMGEGSGILILEELDYARKRGARIYGEIFGYGLSGEAYHMTALEESGKNVVRCIKNCLKEGNIGLDQVDYLNAHGTSTPLNDIVESVAIRKCFGEYTDKLNVSSTKSMHGHCLGAAGAIEAVATILAIKNDIIPPTINLENQDEKCDLNYTPNVSIAKKVNIALSNSMGFGGHNVTLGFKKYIS
ncbi:MAG: beta-ketoacyl-ACP synthase II [Actinobacteria bacterium]|nr:beta-ketoacyl-ACP synthase II [Actinomycetota bacterium]MCL5069448.1 beta-ketoacyl-ACP synthase II [Actinomycetota bacterium]